MVSAHANRSRRASAEPRVGPPAARVRFRFSWTARRIGPALCAFLLALTSRAAVADEFDWNHIVVGGQTYSFVTPVRNQDVPQKAGTCWAFASIAALEAQYKITRADPSFNIDLSEQMLVNSGAAGTVSGGFTDRAMNYLTTTGVVTEQRVPYTASGPPPGWTQPSGPYCVATSDQTSILGLSAAIKADLRQYGPLTANLFADNDFWPADPLQTGVSHSVLITGYRDDASAPGGGYFIAKNSWGTAPPDQNPREAPGYFEVPYSVVGADSSAHYVCAFTGPAYFTGALASATWNGGSGTWAAGTSTWSSSGSSYAWVNQETQAVFNASGAANTVTISGAAVAHGLTLNAGAAGYTITGGALTITGSGISAAESVAINSPVTVGAPQTWTIGAGKQLSLGGTLDLNVSPLTLAGGGNVVLGGIITDVRGDPILGAGWTGSVGGLTLAGSGTVTLGAANTFGGATTLSSGTLVMANAAALQYSTLNLNGGTLNFGGLGSLALGGLSGSQNLTLANTAGASVSLTVGANNQSATYSGILAGPGSSVAKTGSGAWTLSGANSFGGTLSVTGGTLVVPSINAPGANGPLGAGTGTIVLGSDAGVSGTLSYTGAAAATLGRSLRLASGGGLDVSAGSLALSGSIGGIGGLTKTGTGTLTLPSGNTYQGATNVLGGMVRAGAASSFGSNPTLNLNTGKLQFTSAMDTSTLTVNLVGGTNTLDTNGYNVSMARSIGGGSANFIKAGAGLLTFSGSNGFNGSTRISGGTLAIAANSSLGTGVAAVQFAGGTLRLTASGINNLRSLNILGGVTGTVDTGGFDATMSGAVLGSGDLAKTGGGALTLPTAGSFSGNVTISGGALVLAHGAALGSSGGEELSITVASGAALQIEGGISLTAKTLTLNGDGVAHDGALRNLSGDNDFPASLTLASNTRINSDSGTLTLSGTSALSGPTSILSIGGAGNLTIESPITSLAELFKDGAGTLVLSGSNSFSGPIIVTAGTLDFLTENSMPSWAHIIVADSGRVVFGSMASIAAQPSYASITATFEPASSGASSPIGGSLGEGFSSPAGGSPVTVPEPSSILLLASGAISVWIVRRLRHGK